MTERKYEHTFDMDQLAGTAAEYEAIVANGQTAADRGQDGIALNYAIDALVKAQEMFYLVLPEDVREEFWDALEAATGQKVEA